MLCKVVVFVALVAVSLASSAKGPVPDKPEKFKDVEGCYFEDLDAVVPFGQSAPAKGSCMQYHCEKEGVGYLGCGVIGVGPGYKKVEDVSKPHPGCCPRAVEDTIATDAIWKFTNPFLSLLT